MTTFIQLVRDQLVAATAVTDLVGQNIFPGLVAQGTPAPFVVMTIVSDLPINSADGTVETRLRNARVQLTAYAKTYAEAYQVAAAVTAVVGNLGAADLSAYEDARRDVYDDATQLHGVAIDFTVSA